jgi:hypothetical protein
MFEAYPVVFSVGHGFSAGITGLMFLGVFLGGVISTIIYLVYFNPRYKKATKRYAPDPTPPEVRIEFCLMAAPLLVIAFFVFGWTSYPTLSWVGPCIGGGILGVAVLAIFVSLFNYVSPQGIGCHVRCMLIDRVIDRRYLPLRGGLRIGCQYGRQTRLSIGNMLTHLCLLHQVCRSVFGAVFPLFATQSKSPRTPF